MKQSVQIMADFDKPELLKNMVEKLVNRTKTGFTSPESQLQTASTEAYVCGTVTIDEEGEKTNLPFDGSFLFTCVGPEGSDLEMSWSSSLS